VRSTRGRLIVLVLVLLTSVTVLYTVLSSSSRDRSSGTRSPDLREEPWTTGEAEAAPSGEDSSASNRRTDRDRAEKPRAGIRGVVFTPAGAAASGATVFVHVGEERRHLGDPIHADDQGVFQVELDGAALHDVPCWISATRDGWTSHQIRVGGEELEKVPWIAIPLRGSCRVTARAVDDSGAVVPNANFLVIVLPNPVAGEEWGRAILGSYVRVAGNADGELSVPVPPGRVRISARSPDGLFGPQARGTVAAGGEWTAGDVEVGSGRFVARLRVTDEHGSPVEGAGVRVQRGDNLQRLIGKKSQLSHRLLHYETGPNGHVAVPLRCAPDAAWMAIGSSRHSIARVIVGRAQSGEAEYVIRLSSRRRIPIRVRLHTGEPVPADVTHEWRRVVHKATRDSDRKVIHLGVTSEGVGELAESIPPEKFLKTVYRKRLPVPESEPGKYSAFVDGPGVCRLELAVPPELVLRKEFEVPVGGDPGPVEFVLPPGRPVSVALHPSTTDETRPFAFVWAGRNGWPPSEWPTDRLKQRELHTSRGTLEFDAFHRVYSGTFWFPAGCSEVVVGWEQGPDSVGLLRKDLPTGRGPVGAEFRAPAADAKAHRLNVRVVSAGRPLRQHGIPLLVREEGAPERRLTSDRDGEFVLAADPGPVELVLRVPPGRGRAKKIVVGEPNQVVEFDLTAR